mmetsp:Transcript_57279/g.134794  ORF Transcript_57279/g.134794 Transcript_57279/m.134794 type:complete len:262 (+) Transcript_57279:19-804(+)|eukprot:CAMPEP_0175836448 /NCGR_PEP_ID=MMETSP0107_2-20121207/17147_1 /TAXON_ID=195067 ORGANISM="Goniomonas pacifica, Strain CCMP1869" /NCGR_SAMPLE_ID=MMETSP0107_2 /ASSEMBLY_ACC=CAM_ASM_000203 /LENGTH=261 /DNA_ID=CAMNT_0017149841 /DNA_START=12 /DNA_END=797 /DNA_ORIENTATION=-
MDDAKQPLAPNAEAHNYPALAVLDQVPGLFVRQKAQWLEEVAPACEVRNKYQIKVKPPHIDQANRDHEIRHLPMLWKAKEHSDCMPRICCHPYQELDMRITDAQEHEVLNYHRPFKCTLLCPPLLLAPQEIQCILTGGGMLGKVVQNYKCCNFSHWFNVFDATDTRIYELKIPCLQFGPNCICERFVVEIILPDTETKVGTIQNVWPGCNLRALCSKADNLEITFDTPVPSHHKAILLGGVFLIDYMFFERRNQDQQQFQA